MAVFAKKLKQAMEELGLNQKQVCEMTGKCKSSISQYLSGTQIPSERTQEAMAAALRLQQGVFPWG